MKLKRAPEFAVDKYDQHLAYILPPSARLRDIYDAIYDDENCMYRKFVIVFEGRKEDSEYEDPDSFFMYDMTEIRMEVIDECFGIMNFLKTNYPSDKLAEIIDELKEEVKKRRQAMRQAIEAEGKIE